MKQKTPSILISALVVILLLTMPAQVARADGTLCYQLSSKDCKVLTAAETNFAKMQSFQGQYTLNAKLKSKNGQTLTIISSGTLSFKYDPRATNRLKSITARLDGTDTVTSENITPDLKQDGKFGLIILDSVYYTTTYSRLGWSGYDFNDQIFSGVGDTMEKDLNRLMNAKVGRAFSDFLADPAIPAFFAAMPTIKSFASLLGTSNTPVLQNQNQVEFLYTFNVPTLIKAKELRPVWKSFLKVAVLTVGQSTSMVTDPIVNNVAILFSSFFTGSKTTIARWVGVKDGLFHALIFDTTLKFDPGTYATSVMQAGSLTAHFEVEFSKVNQPIPTVEAPEDALMFLKATVTPTPTATPRGEPTITPTQSRLAPGGSSETATPTPGK